MILAVYRETIPRWRLWLSASGIRCHAILSYTSTSLLINFFYRYPFGKNYFFLLTFFSNLWSNFVRWCLLKSMIIYLNFFFNSFLIVYLIIWQRVTYRSFCTILTKFTFCPWLYIVLTIMYWYVQMFAIKSWLKEILELCLKSQDS